MKLHTIIAITILFGYPVMAVGDSPATPRPVVFVSPSGGYYFRLIPSEDFPDSKAEGFLYRVGAVEDELLYQTKGWYSFAVLVSNDGKSLVRIGRWPSINSSPEETPALVFYSGGNESKVYFVSDLIDDLSSLKRSVSHYSWGGPLNWVYGGWDGRVKVETVEGNTIVFNIETAAIEQRRLTTRCSGREEIKCKQ